MNSGLNWGNRSNLQQGESVRQAVGPGEQVPVDSAIHQLLVSLGVGVGIGVGINPHCVTSSFSCPNPSTSSFDADSDTDPDTEIAPPTCGSGDG